MDSAHEVALAGNGEHCLGACLFYDLPRQGAACRHEEVEAHFLRQFHQIADIATAAAFAVVRISRNLVGTGCELQTVWRKNQQTIRRDSDTAMGKEQIAYRDKGGFQLPPRFSEKLSKLYRDGKQEPDQLIGLLLQHTGKGPALDGQYHIADAARHEKRKKCQQNSYHGRQSCMEIFQSQIAESPYTEKYQREQRNGEQKQSEEPSFLWSLHSQ